MKTTKYRSKVSTLRCGRSAATIKKDSAGVFVSLVGTGAQTRAWERTLRKKVSDADILWARGSTYSLRRAPAGLLKALQDSCRRR